MVSISDDVTKIVAASEDQVIRVWDIETGGVLGLFNSQRVKNKQKTKKKQKNKKKQKTKNKKKKPKGHIFVFFIRWSHFVFRIIGSKA